jgi:hypothetical protein
MGYGMNAFEWWMGWNREIKRRKEKTRGVP